MTSLLFLYAAEQFRLLGGKLFRRNDTLGTKIGEAFEFGKDVLWLRLRLPAGNRGRLLDRR